jgi:dihydroorotate dehydrogenase electron transfer subunit
MPKAVKAVITDKRPLGASAFAVDLRQPEIAAEAGPGMFVMVRGADGTDPITPRPISVFARTQSKGRLDGLTLLIKVLGPGTKAVQAKAVGDYLSVTGPLGNPLRLREDSKYLLVAGGTGIAPAAFAAQELSAKGGRFDILYGGRTRDDLHISELARLGLDPLLATENGSVGRRGLVTEAMEEFLDRSRESPVVFACGPWEMMRRCARICAERGLESACSLERYMACGYGVCLSCVFKKRDDERYHTCCGDGPVVNGLEVDWDA